MSASLAQAGAPVARHRNLPVAADPLPVLQHAYRALLVNKPQDLGTTQ